MILQMIARTYWLFGPVAGFIGAALVTTVFTTNDWVRNYGDIFRDTTGTNWTIVSETAVSWFVPSFIYITLLATLGHLIGSRIRLLYREYISNKSDESNK